MHDDQFRTILTFFGLRWDGYRRVRKGVKKRLRAHMQMLQCRDVGAYLRLIASDPEAYADAAKRLLVPISRFFRDAMFWEWLESTLLPELLSQFPHKIRLWSAGCACGEEVYSFRMVWDRLAQRTKRMPPLQIWATDANPACLQRAQRGVYPSSSLKELPPKMRATYFKPMPNRREFEFTAALMQDIMWQEHDLLTPPPLAECEIILLRNNLCTYYTPDIQHQALKTILQTLVPKGLFCIGAKEHLQLPVEDLRTVSVVPYAFRKSGRPMDHSPDQVNPPSR